MLVGIGSYAYYGRSTTYKGGDPSSEEHQGFNPLIDLKLPEGLEHAIKHVFVFSSLDPVISYTEKLQDAEVTFTMHFRDPFLLLAMTTYNTMPTSWTGTGDAITGDFSKETNRTKNIWVQIHINDNSGSGNHVNLLLDGGLITHYKLSGKQGSPVIEEVTIKFCEISVNTQAVDIDDGFDDGAFDDTGIDGGFSNWDGGYASDACVMTVDCTLTWNDAAIPGMGVQNWEIEINTPHGNLWVASSLTASENVPGTRDPPFIGRVTGFGTGNNAIAEWVATKENKTQGTFKILYGTTKYLQITTTVLKSIKGLGIPSAGKAVEGVTHEYEAVDAGAFSFSWTATEATDPEVMVNHTNI